MCYLRLKIIDKMRENEKNYIKDLWDKCDFKEICNWIFRKIRREIGEEVIFEEKIMEYFFLKI